jgi:hypothetical protein
MHVLLLFLLSQVLEFRTESRGTRLKNASASRVLKGYGFSRAVRSIEIKGALPLRDVFPARPQLTLVLRNLLSGADTPHPSVWA